MSEIQSGKELCDQFFETLRKRDDIDQGMAALLIRLYSENKLTGNTILNGLQASRAGIKDETED
jgi:hypothetical protein